uniref:Uncharacterized protein n=1 Tax=Siphoviridae sp. ctF7F8 TaxID=2826211 RepID=A0A8S5MJM4_9CAUD|nr:MAG TPA: hypothetical protein [Siphoviridae sp. ctF7F8]
MFCAGRDSVLRAKQQFVVFPRQIYTRYCVYLCRMNVLIYLLKRVNMCTPKGKYTTEKRRIRI